MIVTTFDRLLRGINTSCEYSFVQVSIVERANLSNISLEVQLLSSSKMRSILFPPNVFLALTTHLAITSALPIHNPNSTPAGLTGIYNGARLDNILRREKDTSLTLGSKFGEPILPRDPDADNAQARDAFDSEFHEPILPREANAYSAQARDAFDSEFHEPILPREPDADNAQVRDAFDSEFHEPILPRDPDADASQDGKTEIQAKDSTITSNGKAEVWVEARFDPKVEARAEVVDGRRTEKGKWRSAVNQFLPS